LPIWPEPITPTFLIIAIFVISAGDAIRACPSSLH
jgi:hypothetical protein